MTFEQCCYRTVFRFYRNSGKLDKLRGEVWEEAGDIWSRFSDRRSLHHLERALQVKNPGGKDFNFGSG
jgi:hypothetical protein